MGVQSEYAKHLETLGLNNDAAFLKRCFSTSMQVYQNRLKAIGFTKGDRVLDVGAGFGQWAIALASMNKHVMCCDIAQHRIDFINRYTDEQKIGNIEARVASLPSLPYLDGIFDNIFCYGVLFCTPWKESLQELFRLLRQGGRLYVTMNGLGYSLSCWKNPRHTTADYDPRVTAWKALRDTLAYEQDGTPPERQLIVERKVLMAFAEEIGFSVIAMQGEGLINIGNVTPAPKPFFPEEFQGFDCCYEALLEKK